MPGTAPAGSGITPEAQAAIDAAREAGGDLFNAAAPEQKPEEDRFDLHIPLEKLPALIPTIVRLAEHFTTPEEFAKAVSLLGPKAPRITQNLWQFAKSTKFAQGPLEPDWGAIYKNLKNPEKDTKALETSASDAKPAESDDSIFDRYQPSIIVKGAMPNSTPLAESAAMASVKSPPSEYKPKLAKQIVTDGILSDAQLEFVVLSGQAHSSMLPGTQVRQGMFSGDGTGVGKTREIVGVFLDNWNQGRKKHIWFTENSGLIGGAKKGMEQLLWDPTLLILHGKTKLGEDITAKQGILFSTYSTLSREVSHSGGAQAGNLSRLDQIVKWAGKDFDGVIVFDESHKMGNVLRQQGARGVKTPSAQALAGVELQKQLPNARVLYMSATGATEVMNLGYATRLGLWGPGTAFNTVNDFVTNIGAAGVAAMEMVARDMKSMGLYVSRNISYHGVEYEKLVHDLTPEQTDVYDELAGAWQLVLRNMAAAMQETMQANSGAAKSSANSKFWGAHQRFFNQVMTAMQMPTVLDKIEESVKAGRAVVIQLVNTNAASQDRILSDKAKEAADTGEEIDYESMDFTPRQQLMDYIERGFPTQQYEEYADDDGNIRYRPAVDSEGKPIQNADAVRMREDLLTRLAGLRVPDNPLDMMIEHFGHDKVAEVTGRTQRIVTKPDAEGVMKKQREPWSKVKGLADANAFQDDGKQILAFSAAGGTGMDYHADLSRKNQRPRDHIILQAGWRADSAVQGFGRTHRNNQKQPPKYHLASTNLKAQKRFTSTIARRLDGLGALTKGQRDTGSQGMFTAMDNLESRYSVESLRSLYQDIVSGTSQSELGFTQHDFEEQTGQALTDENGNLDPSAVDIKRFLNRMLNFKVGMMNKVWDAFESRLINRLEIAEQRGELDTGMETINALSAKVERRETLNTDQRTGAKTEYQQVEMTQPTKIATFKQMEDRARSGFVQNIKSGQVYAWSGNHNVTMRSGQVLTEAVLYSHKASHRGVPLGDVEETGDDAKWKTLSVTEAEPLIKAQIEATPKTFKETAHMITGALLPIWSRLKGSNKVFRITLDDGTKILGRREDDDKIAPLLDEFKIAAGNLGVKPVDVIAALEAGRTVRLSDGTSLAIRSVYQDGRIELKGPKSLGRVTGKFSERIGYELRYFLPRDNATQGIEELMLNNPPVEGIKDKGETFSAAAPEQKAAASVAAGPKGRPQTTADRKAAQAAAASVTPPGILSRAFAAVKTGATSAYRWWGEMPKYTNIDEAIGKWLGAGDDTPFGTTGILVPGRQKAADDARHLAETVKKQFPNLLTQMAIARYNEAQGDIELLKEWEHASKPALKKVYERAQNLTPAERGLGDEATTFWKEKGEEAQKLGLVGDLLDNYVTHFVERNVPQNQQGTVKAQILGDIATSKLKTKFDHAMRRVFRTMLDLEQHGMSVRGAGGIGETMAAYAQAANNTIADRVFVKSLTELDAPDGRPYAAPSGSMVKTDGDLDAPLLIKPMTKGHDYSDYLPIPHPALRKWKWIGKDSDGKDVMLEGELLIHPDLFQRLKNTLGHSAMRDNAIVRTVGGFQGFAKQLMLSFSAFHFVQEGTHAIGHRVAFWKLHEINMDDPVTRELVNAGLMLVNWNAKSEFAEGLSATGMEGILSKIGLGGLGRLNDQLTSFLFERYIPGLKIAMGKAAFERNLRDFRKEIAAGTMTRGDVAQKTAQQANDAFGEQNNQYAGNNPTRLHAEQLFFLAPDFLKSRAKFFADALRRHGGEQRKALLFLAIVMAVTAKLIERMLTGKNDWHKPFSVVADGREYELRSVPGDVLSLIQNTRQFVMARVSPLISRTALEAITGRDWRGQKRSGLEQLIDAAKTPIPISVRGFVDPAAPEISPIEQVGSAMGLRTRRHSVLTKARILGHEWQKAQGVENPDEAYPPSKYLALRNALEDGNAVSARKAYAKLLETIPKDKVDTGFKSSLMKPFGGSQKAEPDFVKSLGESDRTTYREALRARAAMLATFNRIAASTHPSRLDIHKPVGASASKMRYRELTASEFFK